MIGQKITDCISSVMPYYLYWILPVRYRLKISKCVSVLVSKPVQQKRRNAPHYHNQTKHVFCGLFNFQLINDSVYSV